MKKHEKNLPPEGHQPPPPPEKHRHRRRGPRIGTVLLLIIILAVAALVILWQNGYIHFGKDSGQGSGDGGTSVVSNAVSGAADSSETSEESTVIEIKVDNEKIYLDGKELANSEELKSKITEIGGKKTYNFVHDSAIKSAYDEVKSVLTDLERALGIKVNYNEM